MEGKAFVLVAASACAMLGGITLALGHQQRADDARTAMEDWERKYRKKVAGLARIHVGTHITYRGEVIGRTSDLDNPNIQLVRITELAELLERDKANDCDPTWICLDNLVVLQFEQQPDPLLLERLSNTIWFAGYDIVHVSNRGGW